MSLNISPYDSDSTESNILPYKHCFAPSPSEWDSDSLSDCLHHPLSDTPPSSPPFSFIPQLKPFHSLFKMYQFSEEPLTTILSTQVETPIDPRLLDPSDSQLQETQLLEEGRSALFSTDDEAEDDDEDEAPRRPTQGQKRLPTLPVSFDIGKIDSVAKGRAILSAMGLPQQPNLKRANLLQIHIAKAIAAHKNPRQLWEIPHFHEEGYFIVDDGDYDGTAMDISNLDLKLDCVGTPASAATVCKITKDKKKRGPAPTSQETTPKKPRAKPPTSIQNIENFNLAMAAKEDDITSILSRLSVHDTRIDAMENRFEDLKASLDQDTIMSDNKEPSDTPSWSQNQKYDLLMEKYSQIQENLQEIRALLPVKQLESFQQELQTHGIRIKSIETRPNLNPVDMAAVSAEIGKQVLQQYTGLYDTWEKTTKEKISSAVSKELATPAIKATLLRPLTEALSSLATRSDFIEAVTSALNSHLASKPIQVDKSEISTVVKEVLTEKWDDLSKELVRRSEARAEVVVNTNWKAVMAELSTKKRELEQLIQSAHSSSDRIEELVDTPPRKFTFSGLSGTPQPQNKLFAKPMTPAIPAPTPAVVPPVSLTSFPTRSQEKDLDRACVYLRETTGCDYRPQGLTKIRVYPTSNIGDAPSRGEPLAPKLIQQAITASKTYVPGTGQYSNIEFNNTRPGQLLVSPGQPDMQGPFQGYNNNGNGNNGFGNSNNGGFAPYDNSYGNYNYNYGNNNTSRGRGRGQGQRGNRQF
ncbi:hypothetical protein BJ508DRAFT_327059 [Ascobolus immersus RN42]|uniref:Uncharacterized protein n=1 Tax=Ascobolus immersus RN42 TaxID=1160509 RepID=A0A3N4IGD2_ASCIM|nr:hypothetical protein BJ508DRAFT_327059 [Ascobolus immersus RN42]